MSDIVKEVVRRGAWLYDGSVPGEIQVIKTDFCEEPDYGEENPGYPPRDADGNFYYVQYTLVGRSSSSISKSFASVERSGSRGDHNDNRTHPLDGVKILKDSTDQQLILKLALILS